MIKLLTDLIDALGKVAGRLKAIANLPKAERETMCRTLDETYRLIDTTLNMVIIRLNILLLAADAEILAKPPVRITTTSGCRRSGSTGCAIGKGYAYD